MTDWVQAFTFNTECPPAVDKESAFTVRERKDFKKITFQVPVDPQQPEGEKREVFNRWEYLERTMTKEEWPYFEDLRNIRESQDTLMLGIVDLYEMNLGV